MKKAVPVLIFLLLLSACGQTKRTNSQGDLPPGQDQNWQQLSPDELRRALSKSYWCQRTDRGEVIAFGFDRSGELTRCHAHFFQGGMNCSQSEQGVWTIEPAGSLHLKVEAGGWSAFWVNGARGADSRHLSLNGFQGSQIDLDSCP